LDLYLSLRPSLRECDASRRDICVEETSASKILTGNLNDPGMARLKRNQRLLTGLTAGAPKSLLGLTILNYEDVQLVLNQIQQGRAYKGVENSVRSVRMASGEGQSSRRIQPRSRPTWSKATRKNAQTWRGQSLFENAGFWGSVRPIDQVSDLIWFLPHIMIRR